MSHAGFCIYVSCTVLTSFSVPTKHLYRHPQRLAELQQAATAGHAVIDHEKAMEDFLVFYEDLYMELSKFGRIDGLHVCDNLGEFKAVPLAFHNLAWTKQFGAPAHSLF